MKLDDLLSEYRDSLEAMALPELRAPAQRGTPGPFARLGLPSGLPVGFAVGLAAAVLLAIYLAPREPGVVRESPPARVAVSAPARALPFAPVPPPAITPRNVRRSEVLAPRAVRPPGLQPNSVFQPKPVFDAKRVELPFVELAESAMLPAPAIVQIVRVSVRSERLSALGIALPVGAEEIDAEVLVGDDGIARALRLVSY